MMRTIVFSNQKGGTGKTTLSVLYAMWLQERNGQRVCFIDLDSQANASKTLRSLAGGVTAADLLKTETFAESAVETASLRLLPGSSALMDIDRGRPEAVIPALKQSLSRLASSFDACVIDTPPALGLRMSAALIAGTHVICPIELEEYSIDGVTAMLKTIFGVRQRYNPALRLVGIVANRFNGHSVRQKQALVDLIAMYSEFMVPAKLSLRSAIPEGLATATPVWRMTKTAAREATEELSRLFEVLDQRIAGVEVAPMQEAA